MATVVSDSMVAMIWRSLAALAAAAIWLTACGSSGNGAAPPKLDPTLPAPGAYVYRTSGFERLSAVVASRHDYPRLSPVSYSEEGCGLLERWEPRPERSSESRFCTRGTRWRLASLVDYHEFFGQPVRQRFDCRGPFVPRPPSLQEGFRWTDRCRGAGSRVTVSYRAVRLVPLTVSSKRVMTVLVRARAVLRGRIEGVNLISSWLARANGLLVRRIVESSSAIDSPFGRVRDRERYSLQLRSLTPG